MTPSAKQGNLLRPMMPADIRTIVFGAETSHYSGHAGAADTVWKPGGVGTNPAMNKLVQPDLSPYGQAFLHQLSTIVLTHLDNADFTVAMLAEGANMSRAQLHRKLKFVADMTPTAFIQAIRLTRAAELLAGGGKSVTQVAYAVGFEHLSYFARVFQERYGVLPSQYGKVFALAGA